MFLFLICPGPCSPWQPIHAMTNYPYWKVGLEHNLNHPVHQTYV